MGQINCVELPILSVTLNTPPVINSVANLIGYTFSDWIPVSSVDRRDGGRWPLLMHRTHAIGSPRPGVARGGALHPSAWAGAAR